MDAPIAHLRKRDLRLARLWLSASIIVVFLAGSSAPTPLYERYESLWQATPLIATVAFAAYALAVLGGLLCLGELTHLLGRRTVIVASILVQAAALVLFATAESFAPIIVGRVLQGIGAGAALGTLGAIMIEAHHRYGTTASAAAPGIGTGLGALASGLIVEFLPHPTQLVYLILFVILMLQALAVVTLIAPDSRLRATPSLRKTLLPKIGVPARGRSAFRAAAPMVFAVWGLAGFYASLGPALLHRLAHDDSVTLGSIGLFTLAVVAAITVVVVRRARPVVVALTGSTALLAGLALTIVAIAADSAEIYLAATAIAGIGFGSGFHGGLSSSLAVVDPPDHPGVLSAVFVVAYLGMAIPAVVAGTALNRGATLTVVAAAAAAILAVLATAALALSLRAHVKTRARHSNANT